MCIKFLTPTRHGAVTFPPNTPLAFENPLAEPYFKGAGFAEDCSDEPVMTYADAEVVIDPATVFGTGPNVGQLVVADLVQEG